jgi:hypothetical protein
MIFSIFIFIADNNENLSTEHSSKSSVSSSSTQMNKKIKTSSKSTSSSSNTELGGGGGCEISSSSNTELGGGGGCEIRSSNEHSFSTLLDIADMILDESELSELVRAITNEIKDFETNRYYWHSIAFNDSNLFVKEKKRFYEDLVKKSNKIIIELVNEIQHMTGSRTLCLLYDSTHKDFAEYREKMFCIDCIGQIYNPGNITDEPSERINEHFRHINNASSCLITLFSKDSHYVFCNTRSELDIIINKMKKLFLIKERKQQIYDKGYLLNYWVKNELNKKDIIVNRIKKHELYSDLIFMPQEVKKTAEEIHGKNIYKMKYRGNYNGKILHTDRKIKDDKKRKNNISSSMLPSHLLSSSSSSSVLPSRMVSPLMLPLSRVIYRESITTQINLSSSVASATPILILNSSINSEMMPDAVPILETSISDEKK